MCAVNVLRIVVPGALGVYVVLKPEGANLL